jgi:hypothetical protein
MEMRLPWQRQVGEDAVALKPLPGDAAVRLFGLEVGDDAGLVIVVGIDLDAGLTTQPGIGAIGGDQQVGVQFAAVGQRSGHVRGPRPR